ncbi:hypothetical protein NDU88_005898 [Pleurodeles waltl]|uniref:Uncharacterized protein n=1 Tax=Pleurodeles waltl TaxID=8319 RepID=A0AAV7NQE0_PLEWA|nr:hypothetical protein NDU88_005898 [Pleurodeles waltl]
MITAKRGPESITHNISFHKKVHAPDFQVLIDISSCDLDPGSIIDQANDDVASQSPCLVVDGALSSRLMSSDVQSPDDRVVLDHGTCRSVPVGSDMQNSDDRLVVEPVTHRPGPAGSVVSSLGDGPYNLRPRP